MELAGAEGALLGILALDGIEVDLLELDRIAVPVGGILDDADVLVGFPLGEGEVAIADHVAGARPRGAALVDLAEFLDGGAVERVPGGVARHRREVGHGMGKGEDECGVILGADADLGGIGDLAGVEGLAVFEREKKISVLGGERGREDAAVGEDVVVRGDAVAIGPFGAGAEMKRPREIVRRDLPALGAGGDGLAGLHIVLGEPLEERLHDVVVLLAGDELGVEIDGLGEIAVVEDLVAIAELDRGDLGAFGAAGKGEGGEQRDARGGQGGEGKFHT